MPALQHRGNTPVLCGIPPYGYGNDPEEMLIWNAIATLNTNVTTLHNHSITENLVSTANDSTIMTTLNDLSNTISTSSISSSAVVQLSALSAENSQLKTRIEELELIVGIQDDVLSRQRADILNNSQRLDALEKRRSKWDMPAFSPEDFRKQYECSFEPEPEKVERDAAAEVAEYIKVHRPYINSPKVKSFNDYDLNPYLSTADRKTLTTV